MLPAGECPCVLRLSLVSLSLLRFRPSALHRLSPTQALPRGRRPRPAFKLAWCRACASLAQGRRAACVPRHGPAGQPQETNEITPAVWTGALLKRGRLSSQEALISKDRQRIHSRKEDNPFRATGLTGRKIKLGWKLTLRTVHYLSSFEGL